MAFLENRKNFGDIRIWDLCLDAFSLVLLEVYGSLQKVDSDEKSRSN